MTRKIFLLVGAVVGMLVAGLVTPVSATSLYFDFNQNSVGLTANASLFLFGASGQTATVTTLSGFNQNVVLNASGFFNLPIANTFQQGGTGIKNTGFKV